MAARALLADDPIPLYVEFADLLVIAVPEELAEPSGDRDDLNREAEPGCIVLVADDIGRHA